MSCRGAPLCFYYIHHQWKVPVSRGSLCTSETDELSSLLSFDAGVLSQPLTTSGNRVHLIAADIRTRNYCSSPGEGSLAVTWVSHATPLTARARCTFISTLCGLYGKYMTATRGVYCRMSPRKGWRDLLISLLLIIKFKLGKVSIYITESHSFMSD